MPSSTVKREKLLSPLALAFIASLFAVAFFVLLPTEKKLQLRSAGVDKADVKVGDADHLDVAYLKARIASGDSNSEEVAATIVSMLRARQTTEAFEIVQNNPNLELGLESRFVLDLELAAAESAQAGRYDINTKAGSTLHHHLTYLIEHTEFHSKSLLERGLQLSKDTNHPEVIADYFDVLAKNDVEGNWQQACGDYLSAVGFPSRSVKCYAAALADTNNPEAAFNLQLKMLPQLAISGDQLKLSESIKSLSARDDLSVTQRKQLAAAFLGVERPGAAVEVFVALAEQDPEGADGWYSDAARWAEASGQPEKAAMLLQKYEIKGTRDEKLAHERKITSLLLASGNREKALARSVAQVKSQPGNANLLRENIVLARQLGDWPRALEWNTALLALEPDDTEAMSLQVDLAMAQSDLETAHFWATKAVETEPENLEFRKRLAQLAEWKGNPVEAQRQWQALAEKSDDTESLGQLTRLAELNLQPGFAADAKYRLHLKKKPDNAEISDLVKLYELDGRPDLAAIALNRLNEVHGKKAYTYKMLAQLHKRHMQYSQSLEAWESYSLLVGDTTEALLSRIELHWFMHHPKQASDLADQIVGSTFASTASDSQILILAEIAWRYKKPHIAELVKPYVMEVEGSFERNKQSSRIVRTLAESGKREEAINAAAEFWKQDRSANMALQGMVLALKSSNPRAVDPFLNHQNNSELQKMPAYWSAVASVYLSRGQTEEAAQAYRRALELDPRNGNALSGVLWMHIGLRDRVAIEQFLENHYHEALNQPELWPAYAVGNLEIGRAVTSVEWFERALGMIATDYGMLLSFADALDLSGQAERAFKVRRYTLNRVRPILASEISEERDVLTRQYGRLLAQYGGANEQEQWTNYLLKTNSSGSEFDQFWREDMAISWLMSSERHEHAQIIMTRLHEKRLQTPVWQNMSVALKNQDIDAVKSILQSGGHVSVGNQILALRQLGREKEAYALSLEAMDRGSSMSDRQMALEQYVSLRAEYPSYTKATIENSTLDGLGIREAGVSARHTMLNNKFGLGVELKSRQFDAPGFSLVDGDIEKDIAVSMYIGDRLANTRLSAGYLFTDKDDIAYSSLKHKRISLDRKTEIEAELAYNEQVNLSPELRVAALRHRLSVGLSRQLGGREYVILQANATEIATRVNRNRVARGLDAKAELGIRGSIGSNAWTASVSAGRSYQDRVDTLPGSLQLGADSTLDSVLATSSTTVAVAASLSRGGVNSEFPQTSSPRYFLGTSLGHSWPDYSFGLQIDAGAGIRIFGEDELSFKFNHDRAYGSESGIVNDGLTTFGMNYRYHF